LQQRKAGGKLFEQMIIPFKRLKAKS